MILATFDSFRGLEGEAIRSPGRDKLAQTPGRAWAKAAYNG